MEFNSTQYYTAQSHVFLEYICENKFFCEIILDCLSGTLTGWINEKNAKKSRDTASLTLIHVAIGQVPKRALLKSKLLNIFK